MLYKEIKVENYLKLMNEYHIGSLLAKIVSSNNYSEQQIASFFSPLEEYDIENNAVLEKAKEFLEHVKSSNKKVFIFGDYDCDGICATTIMAMILEKLGIPYGYYIPSRLNEGYGLNSERLLQAKEKGYEVIVTVDNGVSALEQLKWAKEQGMESFVTDHHIFNEEVVCDCFLHPSLLQQDYNHLCGAGIVYILARYLQVADDKMNILAMIATIGDMMVLDGINIKIVKDGLQRLNEKNYVNVNMIDNLVFPVNEMDVAFSISTKINAVGRVCQKEVSDANLIVKYFLANDFTTINQIYSNVIEKATIERKQIFRQQYQQVFDKLDNDDFINFVYQEDLHVGILGLLANSLVGDTHKISCVLTRQGDKVVGSIRSNGQIELLPLLEEFNNQLLTIGGHDFACGLSLKVENLQALSEYLHAKCEILNLESEKPYLQLDVNDLTIDKVKEVFDHAPYGQGRKIPLLKVCISNETMRMLKTTTQLKWQVNDVEFISFKNKGFDYYRELPYITLYGELRINKFANRISYQVLVQDIEN